MASTDDPNRPDPTDPNPTPTNAWTAEEDAAAQQWADAYITQHQIPVGYGNRDDLINSYRAQRRNGVTHDQALASVPHLLGWDAYTVPGAVPPGGGGGGGGGLGKLPPLDPWTMAPPNLPHTGLAPTPGKFEYNPFHQPTAQDLLQDPSYQFRFNQGQNAIEASAAAKGMLNGTGTLKDLLGYGQDFASQEYKNVWDRSFAGWQGNELARFKTTEGNNASDLTKFNTDVGNQHYDYNAGYQQWLDMYNQWRNNSNDKWNRYWQVANG